MTNEGKTNGQRVLGKEKKFIEMKGTKKELGFNKITSQKRKTFANVIHITALPHEYARETERERESE